MQKLSARKRPRGKGILKPGSTQLRVSRTLWKLNQRMGSVTIDCTRMNRNGATLKHNCNRGIRCVAVGRIKRVSRLARSNPRQDSRVIPADRGPTSGFIRFSSCFAVYRDPPRLWLMWIAFRLKNVIIGNEFKDYTGGTKARYFFVIFTTESQTEIDRNYCH